MNYKTQAGSTFIYIGFNSDATEYYLQWFGNEWVEWTPQPWQQIQFGDIVLTIIEVCKYLIVENPQEFLDAVGSSPSIIAPFADGANAIWYAFKGDWKMAGISAISVLPFIGDGIGASLKATVKIGKRYQTFHLVGEGAELILKTGKRYQNLGNKVVDEALVALGIAINKYGNHVPVLAKIADKVAGPAQLRAMLRAIDDMPDAQREIFFKDLAENSKFADEFFAKVGDNPNLVESWKVLSDAGVPNLSNKLDDIEFVGKYVDEIKGAGGYKAWRDIAIQADNVTAFSNLTYAQKLENIKNIWNTKYPIPDMLGGRSFFEDIMGQYRYTTASGWSHTGEISFNAKGIDFYKGIQQIGVDEIEIFASTAVSMKTTVKISVDEWLKYPSIQDNIRFLREGLSNKGMYDPNNSLRMFIKNAEIHIYMKKANITPSLEIQWLNKLNTDYPDIKFEIKAIEDFIN